jgi:hypothetical protein
MEIRDAADDMQRDYMEGHLKLRPADVATVRDPATGRQVHPAMLEETARRMYYRLQTVEAELLAVYTGRDADSVAANALRRLEDVREEVARARLGGAWTAEEGAP